MYLSPDFSDRLRNLRAARSLLYSLFLCRSCLLRNNRIREVFPKIGLPVKDRLRGGDSHLDHGIVRFRGGQRLHAEARLCHDIGKLHELSKFPENDYTDEDFAKAIFQLKKNFCDERINDVKTIGEKLYGKNKSKPSKTIQKTESVKVEVHNNNEKAGMDPNLKSHQQKVNPVVVLGLVAVVVIIVLVCLLVLK